ncbi:MAG: hypothetical protein JST89_19735 [Cyanobacteria bacterium SZAS-4]|nr:hypothetical protein [Cyanobacteria bacterium SZAS-4]
MKLRLCTLFALAGTLMASCGLSEPAVPSISDKPKSEPYTRTVHCRKHEYELLVPAQYGYSETERPSGKIALLGGPKHEDDKSPAFSLNIVITPEGEKVPPVQIMIDSMLNPFRKHMSDYVETPEMPLTVNGKVFEGATFSGSYAGMYPSTGFVYVNKTDDTFFILFGQDIKSYSALSKPIMMKTVKAFKIIS